ncbi:hypothetical protein Cni_G22739 [Canna indica]|uniref:Uncharacterized protein n=1 Tax=Canna indica TaxID=4628 RepID=A0AAQ3KSC6_9LILI|nr:hypothetical protein Cni_G22739 [Canna indica]
MAKPVKIEEMVAKKLALWHTRTFRPIMNHDELEPIMAAAGFLPLPMAEAAPPAQEGPQAAVAWREYASRSEAATAAAACGVSRRRRAAVVAPRPRLPYPRIDGLHLMAYKAFLLALEFYLGPTLVPNIFHVRTMSLSKVHDRPFEKAYRPMKDCEIDDEGILVYREGTLDHITKITCSHYSSDDINNGNSSISCIISPSDTYIKKANCEDGTKSNAVNSSFLVALKDLFPSGNIMSLR